MTTKNLRIGATKANDKQITTRSKTTYVKVTAKIIRKDGTVEYKDLNKKVK